jgi:hypothetical protein
MTLLLDKFYWTNSIEDLPDEKGVGCIILSIDKELPEEKDELLIFEKTTVFHLPFSRYGSPSEINYTQVRDSIVPHFEKVLFVCDDMQRSLYFLHLLGYDPKTLDEICNRWDTDFLYSDSISQDQKRNLEILTKDIDFFRHLVKEALELEGLTIKDQIEPL